MQNPNHFKKHQNIKAKTQNHVEKHSKTTWKALQKQAANRKPLVWPSSALALPGSETYIGQEMFQSSEGPNEKLEASRRPLAFWAFWATKNLYKKMEDKCFFSIMFYHTINKNTICNIMF